MARKRKIDLDRSSLELLDLTMQATTARFREAIAEGVPVDAAIVSASVSLLKLVEAQKTAKAETSDIELEKLRADILGKRAAVKPFAQTDDDIRREYGLA